MLFLQARFSKMDLRPEPRSTYGIGHRCEKSVVGMGRCGQWQAIKCSSWRVVQQGDRKVTSLVPLANVEPFPKPLEEKEEKRCGKISPCNGQIGCGYQTDDSLCLKPGSHNEGKSGYVGYVWSIPRNGAGIAARRTPYLDRRCPTGITAKSGTRHRCKEAPTLDEKDEPGNLGSSACDDKAPRSANAQVGRRSNRSSLSRLINGPYTTYTKGCSKDRTPSM